MEKYSCRNRNKGWKKVCVCVLIKNTMQAKCVCNANARVCLKDVICKIQKRWSSSFWPQNVRQWPLSFSISFSLSFDYDGSGSDPKSFSLLLFLLFRHNLCAKVTCVWAASVANDSSSDLKANENWFCISNTRDFQLLIKLHNFKTNWKQFIAIKSILWLKW